MGPRFPDLCTPPQFLSRVEQTAVLLTDTTLQRGHVTRDQAVGHLPSGSKCTGNVRTLSTSI